MALAQSNKTLFIYIRLGDINGTSLLSSQPRANGEIFRVTLFYEGGRICAPDFQLFSARFTRSCFQQPVAGF